MKLGLKLPHTLIPQLKKYLDIIVVTPQMPVKEVTKELEDWRLMNREVWYFCDNLASPLENIDLAEAFQADYIVPPFVPNDPRGNNFKLNYLLNFKPKQKVVGVLWAFKKELMELELDCALVALPWERPRTLLIPKGDSVNYHYLGFRNLDELRTNPPRSITTDMPLRAAVHGISLELRERRPSLPPFEEDKISDSQLEQTVANIALLRKASRGLL
jgi:hypothetical protein